jgi:hypothetical protein
VLVHVCMESKQHMRKVHIPIDIILPLFSTDPLQLLYKLVVEPLNLSIRLRVPQGYFLWLNTILVERCKV